MKMDPKVIGRTMLGFVFGHMIGWFLILIFWHVPDSERALGELTLMFALIWLCVGLAWLGLFKFWPKRWWP